MSWALKKAREVWNQDVVSPAAQSRPHLFDMERVLGLVLSHLEESQSQKAETPESGSTSHESAGASPETSTTSTPETGTTALINSLSEHGEQWEELISQVRQHQKNRTTAPTSFTPSTDRTTGPSASIDELKKVLWQCVEALRFTREYVGEETLPAKAGWSWYDATIAANAILGLNPDPAPDSGAAKSGGESRDWRSFDPRNPGKSY